MKSMLILDGKYEIFEDGSFKSHTKVSKGRFLNPKLTKFGYYSVPIYSNKKTKRIFVHRLVAIAFIPNPEQKRTVNHINGIKTDNRIENLEWATHSENILHAYRIGLSNFSESQRKQYSKRMMGKTGTKAHASKKVTDGNIVYASVKEAAIAIGLKYTTLSAMLIGQNRNKTNLKFI